MEMDVVIRYVGFDFGIILSWDNSKDILKSCETDYNIIIPSFRTLIFSESCSS